MQKICVIMGGVMPVPAVYGGAVETLITNIVKKYSKEDGYQLTICSVYDKKACEVAKKYPDVHFFWTHTKSIKNLFLHAIFMGIRMVTGKCIRPLQRHYNEISKLFEQERFDLIIAEGGDTQAIVEIAKGYKREQFVNHVHIHYLPPKNIVREYGHVIGVSDFVTREYLSVCDIPVTPHVLKNGIDVSLFQKKFSENGKENLMKKLGIQKDDFVILYVGRMMEIKGVLELMQVVESMKNQKIKLLIMGSANSGKHTISSYEQKVKKIAARNQEQIIFTGYIPNQYVYQYAAIADVQCVPTLVEEAAGLVVLEAMASGLPTIITNSGGMSEYITDQTTIVIDRKNVKNNLKEAILYLMDFPEIRCLMSRKAILQSQLYDESRYYKNFVAVIQKIIKENCEEDYEI